MIMDDELFGTPDKIALMRRAAGLRALVKDDPRFAYYGRLVALNAPGPDTADILSGLARIQGAGACYYFPKRDVPELFGTLEGRGFSTDRHEHFWGGKEAYGMSRQVLTERALPADLTVTRLDAESPRRLLEDVAALCLSCDVMPVPGSAMRCTAIRGVNLVAMDGNGEPVANAASFVSQHPGSPKGRDVFWGMLATRHDRRGEKIALLLGAMAIVHMWENEGARGFFSGVRHDNPSSSNLCNRLGVRDSEWVFATCIDPVVLGSTSVTK